MQKVQKTYTPELKREAVRLAQTSGKPIAHIARELEISDTSIHPKGCTDRAPFQTRQEACSAIFEYLECFYNPVRLHSTLQYVSPVAFEQATQSQMN